MIKRGLGVFLILMIIIPTIIAYKTDIRVKTEPNQLVDIKIYSSITDDKLAGIFERTNSEGVYTTSIQTGEKEINVYIIAKDNKNIILGKIDFESYTAGEPIVIDFTTAGKNETLPEENITANETEQDENTTEVIIKENEINGNSQITGKGFLDIISNIKSGKSNSIFYIIGIVLIIGAVGFFITRAVLTRRNSPSSFNIVKLSDLKREQKDRKDGDWASNFNLKDVEDKIDSTQKEIEGIKKIKEAEDKLNKMNEELKRLKRGSR
ncbi:MAG: hypothetical protein KKA64_03185 [Nanoarchaeota archaeon]|nr:hypothetical protein [Nanoarchaeota archaeon]